MAYKNYNNSSRNYSSYPTYGTGTTTSSSTSSSQNSCSKNNTANNKQCADPCGDFMRVFNKFRPCIQNVCKSVASSNSSQRHPCFQRCRPFYASHPPPPQNPFPCFSPYQYAHTQQANKIVTVPPGGLKPCCQKERNGQHQGNMNRSVCVKKMDEKKGNRKTDKKSASSSYGTSSNGPNNKDKNNNNNSGSSSSSYYSSSNGSSGTNSKTSTSSSYKTSSKSSPSSNPKSCSSSADGKMKKVVKSRSHEGIDFCFEPFKNLATEVTVCIEPDEPEVLEYALENGIMPIICGYLPPSGAPVVPQFVCNQQTQQIHPQRPSSAQSSASSSSEDSSSSTSTSDSSTSTSTGSTSYDTRKT